MMVDKGRGPRLASPKAAGEAASPGSRRGQPRLGLVDPSLAAGEAGLAQIRAKPPRLRP